MTKLNKSEKIEQFKVFAERINSFPWGVDANVQFHSDTSRVVIATDIGLITYYMTTGKIQVRSHIFKLPEGDAIFTFLDTLFTKGVYTERPIWSSRKVEQDPEFLAKVIHPFIERKKDDKA